jgi:hypothetical protein
MREIPFCPGYFVTESGKVWSSKCQRFLRHKLSKIVYPRVSLCVNGVVTDYYVHRLVAQAYVPNPLGLNEINHKNGIKTDPHYLNLEWCTTQHNSRHAVEHGFIQKGEEASGAKLTEAQVLDIRRRIASREVQARIAERYGMSPTTITDIKNGKSWRHLVG